jgi:hypothetical protein
LTYNLSGVVRNQGLPVAGAKVIVYSTTRNFSDLPAECKISEQTTSFKGEYMIAVPPGKYRLEVQPDNSTRYLRTSVNDLEVSSNFPCNISLSTGAIISGIVRTIDGAHVGSGEIIASGIEPTSYSEKSILEPDGCYSLTLGRGRYHLAFRSRQEFPGSGEADYDGLPLLVKSISVLEVVGDEKSDLILPELVTFAGDVIDIIGRPVSGAHVTVSPSDSQDDPILLELGLNASIIADLRGHFQMKLQPGLYDITVRPGLDELLSLEDKGVPIEKDTHYSFKLVEGFKLRGQVKFGTKLLAQSLVRINGIDKKATVYTKTDAKGQFSIGVPAGTYKLNFTAHPKDAPTVTIEGREYTGLAPCNGIVEVAADMFVSAAIEQGTALHGYVRDDLGKARSGVPISVFANDGDITEAIKPGRELCSAVSDGDGRYCFFLTPGNYSIVVHTDTKNAKLCEIGEVPVELDLSWHGWCQVKFEVTGEDGVPISRCRVGYAPYGADIASAATNETLPHGYLLTSEEGTCSTTLLAGIYALQFTPPLEGSYEPKTIRQISLSSDATKPVKLGLKSKPQI